MALDMKTSKCKANLFICVISYYQNENFGYENKQMNFNLLICVKLLKWNFT